MSESEAPEAPPAAPDEPSGPFPLSLDGVEPADRAAWESAAAAVLRKAGRLGEDADDADVWARLTKRTLDGVEIAPLGTPALLEGLELGARPPARGDGWDVRVAFADPDAETTARQALTDLENGATSLWLQVGPTGLAVEDLPAALEQVLLDVAPVILESDGETLPAARALVGLLIERGVPAAPGTNLGADPLGAALRGRTGTPADVVEVAELAREHGTLALVVDGTAVHDLGGSDTQELGWILSSGAAYLRLLEDAGIAADDAARLVELRVAATDEQFTTIAKLRAVRQTWARLLELCGVEDTTARVHAVTSRPMMTSYDPWVNMLRTCVAAFAAGVGGADAVTVLPFDAALGLPDDFARRIARNTSSLLIDESHVAKVADPAGGAYAVERLTADLAAAGWAELDRLEQTGGAGGDLADLRERIAAVAAERDAQVATRKRPITGVTEFPNLGETLPERRPYAEGSLPVRGYAHAFEALRDEPASTPVFLATMGPIAAHTARATFAANLFAAGGVDTEAAGATDDAEAVVAAWREAGERPVVCLAGTDGAYAEWGADLVTALREAGARHVIVAGKAEIGQDDSCAMGVDALDFLTRTRGALS